MGRHRHRVVAVAVGLAALVATACEPTSIPTQPGTQRHALLGDSLPAWLIRDGLAGASDAAVTLIDGTLAACEGAAGNPPARARSGAIVATPAECVAGWPALYPAPVEIRPDVAIVMAGTHAMLDHRLDGTWRHPCHTPARTWYQRDLEDRLRYLAMRADRVAIVVPAWPTALSQWVMPADYLKRADCVRSLTRAAARNTGAQVIDLGAYLCPGGAATCNSWRSGDGIHIDPSRARSVLAWVLNAAQAP
jgi:hypothetical protein